MNRVPAPFHMDNMNVFHDEAVLQGDSHLVSKSYQTQTHRRRQEF